MEIFSLESHFSITLGRFIVRRLSGARVIQMCTGVTIGNVERGFPRAGRSQWMDSGDLAFDGGEETSFELMLSGRLYKERPNHQNGDGW